MLRKIGLFILLCFCLVTTKAQVIETYEHDSEYGFSVGLGHYFGDLNTGMKLNRPKFSGGIFYAKQINNYVGFKISGNYTFLAYSDIYSNNPTERRRNLSFNTDVWEMSISGNFNFFKFVPGFEEYSFTPYVSLGLGIFSFDPYAFLAGQKYFLRPLGTEGQGSALYPSKKPYSPIAMCIPVGVGMKYALSSSTNIFGEISYRFTNTDYLDDVSGTYAPGAFQQTLPNGASNPAYLLQDRSYETGPLIGNKPSQRGNSSQKDAYITIQVGMSFNIQTYRCPKY